MLYDYVADNWKKLKKRDFLEKRSLFFYYSYVTLVNNINIVLSLLHQTNSKNIIVYKIYSKGRKRIPELQAENGNKKIS